MDPPHTTRVASVFRTCLFCGHVNVLPRRSCEDCGDLLSEAGAPARGPDRASAVTVPFRPIRP